MIVDDFRETEGALGQLRGRRCGACCRRRAGSRSTTAPQPIFHSFFEIESDDARRRRRLRPRTARSFWGIFEDNDPTKRLMVDRQLQHRHLRVLGIVGHGLRADRRIERSVQARRQLHHLRDDALSTAEGGSRGTRRSFRLGRSHRRRRTREHCTNTVDLESPDDIALADRMNDGREQIIAELQQADRRPGRRHRARCC